MKVGDTGVVRGSLTGPGAAHVIFNFYATVGRDDPPPGQ